MSTGIIVTLGVVGGILLISYISWMVFYRVEIKDAPSYRVVEMKSVKRFKGLYAIAPERYELKDYSLYGPAVQYTGEDGWYYLFFSNPIGYLIVRRMLNGDSKAIEREKNRKNRIESEKGFIKEIERDLKEFKEKGEKQKWA